MLSALVVSQALAWIALLGERRFVADSVHRTETFRRVESAVRFLQSRPAESGVRFETILGSRTFRLVVSDGPFLGPEEVDEQGTRQLSNILSGLNIAEVRVSRSSLRTRPGNNVSVMSRPGEEPPSGQPSSWRVRDTHVPEGTGELLFASVRLGPKRWLNVTAIPPPPPRVAPAFLVGVFLAALSLTFAAVWAARRLTRPLQGLTAAAGQVGRDSDFLPAPVEGPEDIQCVAREFNAMSIRVKRLLDEQQLLLRAVGHDLRTPLSSLKIRLEFVKDRALKEKMAETICQMEELTAAALEAARGGAVNEPVRRIDLSSLVEAVCEDAAEIGQPVTFETSGSLDVLGRSAELRRAVQNLVDNGVLYGGGVKVTVRGEGATALIQVEDEGSGIPEADLGRVVEPFVRLDQSRNAETGSHGLGLTIVNAIAERHSGALLLANRSTGGLSACVRLPLAHEAA